MLMAVLLIFVLCWTPMYLLEFSQGIIMMLDKFATISDYKLDIKLWLSIWGEMKARPFEFFFTNTQH